MSQNRFWHLVPWLGACLFVLLTVSPALASSETTSSRWDWDHTWSYQRLVYTALLAAGALALCFHVVFPALIAPRHSNPPWPRDAYGMSLSLFWLLAWGSFLLFFALLEDELHHPSNISSRAIFPAHWTVLNQHWPWILVLVVALVGALFIRLLVRHHPTTDQNTARA